MLCWNEILSSRNNTNITVDFAENNCSFRQFKKYLTSDARRHIVDVTNERTVADVRNLARKALRRRNISYSLTV